MSIVQHGDVWTLGRHRLICGNSSDPAIVSRLFGGAKPDLVFTSPPYLNQRSYLAGHRIEFDAMMQSVFATVPYHDQTQMIVNLGMIHRLEVQWYFLDWLGWMKAEGWPTYGLYIWDKQDSLPGDWHGRFAPCYEFLFHLNRNKRPCNKTKAKKACNIHAGTKWGTLRNPDGRMPKKSSPLASLATHRIPDSVIRLRCEKHNRRGKYGIHPAVFPPELPAEFIEAYTDQGGLVFDPFLGSGTTIIAAERLNRVGYGIELEPAYCDLAIDRLQRALKLNAYREDGESFDCLESPEFFASSLQAASQNQQPVNSSIMACKSSSI